MEKPIISQKSPIAVELKKDETYHWCSCGKSSKQPFCDGSHQGTSFMPLTFTAVKDETAHLCACKHTKNAPYCDGTHNGL
jgi:CDGSH iron-sulfur domain-containing protein 3